jgi:hypothetical protein
VPVFVGSYLAVWAPAGMVVYAVDRPHGSVAAGMTLIVARAYEFTPLKQQFRRRCRDSAGSGFGFGRRCAGSSIGLMAMLVALGVMSIPCMAVITVVVLAQKLLPARAAIDVPLAPAIAGLGILIILVGCRARAAGHGQYLCAQIIQFGARSGVMQRDHNAIHNGGSASVLPGLPVTQRDTADRRSLGSASDQPASVTGLLEVAVGRRPRCLLMQHFGMRSLDHA